MSPRAFPKAGATPLLPSPLHGQAPPRQFRPPQNRSCRFRSPLHWSRMTRSAFRRSRSFLASLRSCLGSFRDRIRPNTGPGNWFMPPDESLRCRTGPLRQADDRLALWQHTDSSSLRMRRTSIPERRELHVAGAPTREFRVARSSLPGRGLATIGDKEHLFGVSLSAFEPERTWQ